MTTAPMGYTVVLRSEVGASAEEALLEYRCLVATSAEYAQHRFTLDLGVAPITITTTVKDQAMKNKGGLIGP
jgi:hypothetical protein